MTPTPGELRVVILANTKKEKSSQASSKHEVVLSFMPEPNKRLKEQSQTVVELLL